MNQQQTSQKITLEDITRRKEELQKEIRSQQDVMAMTARNIFAPLVPAASAGNAMMRSFNTGMAIFDGVMLGVKMIRKVRSLFKNR